jgi:transcriptional regulator with XRE-family HTH domain
MKMADLTRISAAMKTKDDAFFKRLGARIAHARKQMDMTQVQLAERLGVAQQTLAHYEVGRARIAADLLPILAEALELSLDEMLIGEPAVRPAGKRGPASRLQQQIDAIAMLPKAKQRFVVDMLDTVIAQHSA